jgi:hypothetical protein
MVFCERIQRRPRFRRLYSMPFSLPSMVVKLAPEELDKVRQSGEKAISIPPARTELTDTLHATDLG